MGSLITFCSNSDAPEDVAFAQGSDAGVAEKHKVDAGGRLKSIS
jgi:hypothetical protein